MKSFEYKGTGDELKGRSLIVMTAKRARYTRSYGYVITIDPPIEYETKGEDVEGIGLVPHRGGPRKHLRCVYGWYKHKATALLRAKEICEP